MRFERSDCGPSICWAGAEKVFQRPWAFTRKTEYPRVTRTHPPTPGMTVMNFREGLMLAPRSIDRC